MSKRVLFLGQRNSIRLTGNGSSRQHITCYELRDDIQAHTRIRHRLDDSHRDQKCECDENSNR